MLDVQFSIEALDHRPQNKMDEKDEAAEARACIRIQSVVSVLLHRITVLANQIYQELLAISGINLGIDIAE